MVEDQYLWSFLLTDCPVFVNPEPLVRYRQWNGSTCATTIKQEQARHLRYEHLQWLKKHLSESFHDSQYREIRVQIELMMAQEAPDQIAATGGPFKKSTSLSGGSRATQRLRGFRFFQKFQPLPRLLQSRLRTMFGVQPLSVKWGTDRGMSILRYYTEEFLHEYAADIRGRCLEFQEDTYSSRFGKQRIDTLDILHHDNSNPNATLVADLTGPNVLPPEQFDCILCTFVLHVIFNVEHAMAELYRLLTPGGVLLVVVPHISMCDPQAGECWRFTEEGLQKTLSRRFAPEDITMKAYGNALTAAGNIRGLTAHEFTRKELLPHDSRFASIVCARAVKTH
jgi:SAM-dependent methyltransferase